MAYQNYGNQNIGMTKKKILQKSGQEGTLAHQILGVNKMSAKLYGHVMILAWHITNQAPHSQARQTWASSPFTTCTALPYPTRARQHQHGALLRTFLSKVNLTTRLIKILCKISYFLI